MDLKIGHTHLLWLLWLVPLAVVFYFYVFRSKRLLLEKFASPELLTRIYSGVNQTRQQLKAALIVLGILALVLTLAGIKYGFTWEEVKRQGVDIVIALDVSDSMLVQDAEAGGNLSRLERAKREIKDLLRLLQGDRISLVAFAGTAFIQCPLTLDYGAAEIFLDDIDTELIPVKGTALGEALQMATQALDKSAHKSQAIILITDGEDQTGEALEAAEAAKQRGIKIFTIGIGRDEGAPIPDPQGGFRKDARGELILSKLDETTLQKIALTTGGKYVRSVSGDVDLEQVYTQGIKATLEDQELGSRRRQRWEERFQWPLALGALLLMVEAILRERVKSKNIAALLLVSLLAPQSAYAGSAHDAYAAGKFDEALKGFVDEQVEHPNDPNVALNVGSAYYGMRDYASAEKAFSTALIAEDPSVRAQAHYSLGNTYFRQGRLDEAIKSYQSTLDITPDDEDAKYNLEFARNELRRRAEEAKKTQEQNQQQQQEQEQQQEQQSQTEQNKQEQEQENQAQEAQKKDEQKAGQKEEPKEAQKENEGEAAAAKPGDADQKMTREMAERYLQGVNEKRPSKPTNAKKGQRYRVEKDW